MSLARLGGTGYTGWRTHQSAPPSFGERRDGVVVTISETEGSAVNDTSGNASFEQAAFENLSVEAPRRVGVAERSHEWVRGLLGDLLDGTLAPEELAHVEQHLATCPACAAYRRTYQRTVRLVRGLRQPHAPEAAKQRVLKSLP